MEPIQLDAVGRVVSSLRSLHDCPLQGNEGAPAAIVEIAEKFKDALAGIKAGDELLLLTWLHLGKRDTLQCYPRKETTADPLGVFATRSPDRPNPIGVHRVQVIHVISANAIEVFPLEALDGTPVFDIKPYF